MGWHLEWVEKSEPRDTYELAPPVRIVAVVTLFASTFDLLADFLLCGKIYQTMDAFETDVARAAAYGYFFFTFVSIFVYVMEMTDVCLTLKHDAENIFYARLAKSCVLALEEVPLPSLLYVLCSSEMRLSLANPVMIASWIKLVALTWGIVKFTKLRFFWCCLPLNPKHEVRENIRRCFQLTTFRLVMIVVNVCHILAIVIVINNIIISTRAQQLNAADAENAGS